MPARPKKKIAARLVELSIHLQVPRKQYPMVEKALTAVLDLAGQKPVSEKASKTPPASKAKAGRPPKAKPVKMKTSKKPAKPAPARQAAGPKFPETAALIRDLRAKAGLSQKALAEKLGVWQNTVSLLETGKQKPNQDMAVKLGQILKAPVQNFVK
jgi:DNA-binding XRE family transcriptional regulator